ncbi:MAG: adenylate kinase [Bacteroidota bacterium]
MLNIALFGPPGAGKGTQSKDLVEKYKLTYISTGDILREEIANGTEIGLKAKNIIEKGGLAADELIVQIIEQKMKTNPKSNGFLFDGFPRTVVQAYILEGLLHKKHTSLTCMLSLEVPKEELMRRLTERSKTSNRADDNDLNVIKYRLEEYDNKTAPVAKFYDELGKYYPIEGTGSMDQVKCLLRSTIQSLITKVWHNIVILGAPGAGKGTHSELLAKKLNFVHISTGDLLRKEVAEKSDLGITAKEYIDKGELVPDEIVIRLIERKISKNHHTNGFIYDGFPVNLVQAYILDGLLRKQNSSVTAMICMQAPTLVSIKRLLDRGKTSKARSYDSNADIVIHRLESYEETSPKVKEYYKTQGKYNEINSDGDISLIHEQIVEKVEEILMLKEQN